MILVTLIKQKVKMNYLSDKVCEDVKMMKKVTTIWLQYKYKVTYEVAKQLFLEVLRKNHTEAKIARKNLDRISDE